MSARKTEVFVITFLSYTAIHCIRTSYSFIKSDLPDATGYSIQAIGVIDALLLVFLGIGHFIHAIYPRKKPVQTLWIGLLSCSVIMGLLSLCFNVKFLSNYWILAILMCFNGYMQSYTWPMLLMIIHSKFDPSKYNLLLGFWSTNANFGNIIGFGMAKFILSFDSNDWTLVLAFSGVYTVVFGFLVLFRVKQLPAQNQEGSIIKNNQLQPDRIQASLVTSKQSVEEQIKQKPQIDLSIILLTITFSLTKSVIYGILLWLPLYFKSSDQLKDYAAEIPITYDSAAIIGSVFLGQMFRKVENKGFLLNPFMILLLGCFVILRYIHLGVAENFIILAIVGFCLGGTFNTLSGLIVMELVKLLPPSLKTKRLGFYSAVTMGVGNVTTALTQVLIGFVIGKDNQKKIFIVFIIYAAVSVSCLLLLTAYTLFGKKLREKSIQGQYQQVK